MNVLFITGDFPHPHAPAHGLFNQYLARGLAREHNVHVIGPVPWPTAFFRGKPGKGVVPTKPAGGQNPRIVHPIYFYTPGMLRQHYGSFLWWSIRGRVRRLLREFRPDIILAYWAHPDGEVAVRIARDLGIPSGVIVGGSDVLMLTRDPSRRRKVVDVLKGTDAVITVNEHLKEKVKSFGISENKIHKWDQGVDEKFTPGNRSDARERLGIPKEGPAAVWVGRRVPVKGLEILIKACEIIKASKIDFTVYLVGDGPLRQQLEADAAAKGLANVLRFVGTQLHDQLPDWYRAADVTVMSSWSEGLPNVLRESLACGTPFVSTRVGGIDEIAGDCTHWLVEAGDSQALAAAVGKMLSQKETRRPRFRLPTWMQSARDLMQIFSLPASVEAPAVGVPA